MGKSKYRAAFVGIGLFALFVILAVWALVTRNAPNVPQDQGAKLSATKAEAFGSILLPEAVSHIEADGANGPVVIDSDGQPKALPAGRYHVRYWKTERKDDTGNSWVLTGRYYGQENPFDVEDGRHTKLDVGEPIIATIQARHAGSSYSFNQVIKGRLDEIISLTCNGSRPRPPKLNIKNKDGSYDRTFSFQYG
jgi:hypothetical protein